MNTKKYLKPLDIWTLACASLCFQWEPEMRISTVAGRQRRRQWHPTPVLLPGKSHGWRGLVGCSPWGREESDTTERLHFHFSLSWIGKGNGNPLQCSCLENPRDWGALWAAIYGVAQNRTRLKWLSSSSSSILLIWFHYNSFVIFVNIWKAWLTFIYSACFPRFSLLSGDLQ